MPVLLLLLLLSGLSAQGEEVVANYRGRGGWYRGVVAAVRTDGSADPKKLHPQDAVSPRSGRPRLYDIDYDDGGHETGVAQSGVKEAPPRVDVPKVSLRIFGSSDLLIFC